MQKNNWLKKFFKRGEKKKKRNFPELPKPDIEVEAYNDNKNVTEKKRKKLKILVRFHSTNKINNYNRAGGWGTRKKNPKESTEHVKT